MEAVFTLSDDLPTGDINSDLQLEHSLEMPFVAMPSLAPFLLIIASLFSLTSSTNTSVTAPKGAKVLTVGVIGGSSSLSYSFLF